MASNVRRHVVGFAVATVVLAACATTDRAGPSGTTRVSGTAGTGSVAEHSLPRVGHGGGTRRVGDGPLPETVGAISGAFVVNDDLGMPPARQSRLVELVRHDRRSAGWRVTDGWVGGTMRVEDAYGGTVLVHHCAPSPPDTGSTLAGRERQAVAPSGVRATEYVLGLLASGGQRLRWVVTDVRSLDGAACR